jgi:hypothetical protein
MTTFAVLVDPYLFAVPTAGDANTALQYFGRVAQWGRVLRTIESATSVKSVTALRLAKLYPTVEVVNQLIRKYQLAEVSAVDVLNAVRVLSERAPYAEDCCGISDVVACAKLDPALIEERIPCEAAEAFKGVLAMSARLFESAGRVLPDVGTADVPRAEVLLAATVKLVEWTDGRLEECDDRIEAVFDLVQDPSRLIADQGHESLVALDAVAGIRLVYEREVRAHDSSKPLGEVRIGDRFEASLARLGISDQPAVLHRLYFLAALASTGRLAQQRGAKLHAVRESRAADARQVVRENGDRKWRCMLRRAGAGFRFQYWECADGGIELDEVVTECEV